MAGEMYGLDGAIPLMGYESPSGIVHIAGDPLLCESPSDDLSTWFECDGVPLRHVCQRCLRIYMANLRRPGGGGGDLTNGRVVV